MTARARRGHPGVPPRAVSIGRGNPPVPNVCNGSETDVRSGEDRGLAGDTPLIPDRAFISTPTNAHCVESLGPSWLTVR